MADATNAHTNFVAHVYLEAKNRFRCLVVTEFDESTAAAAAAASDGAAFRQSLERREGTREHDFGLAGSQQAQSARH